MTTNDTTQSNTTPKEATMNTNTDHPIHEFVRASRDSIVPANGHFTEAHALALAVIANGVPFEEGWYDDGDAESGPMGGVTIGYVWGPRRVELSPNGSVFLHHDEGTVLPICVHNTALVRRSPDVSVTRSYLGVGPMIADHLHALKSNIDRNGIDWIIGGERKDTPDAYARPALPERPVTDERA